MCRSAIERVVGDADDDDERGERAERVDVVGAAELTAAGERRAHAEALDERGGDGEADEREPGESRQQVEAARSSGNGA